MLSVPQKSKASELTADRTESLLHIEHFKMPESQKCSLVEQERKSAAHDSQMEYAPLHIEISNDEQQTAEEAPERKPPETGIFNTILNFFDLNPKP